MGLWVDGRPRQAAHDLTRQGIEFGEILDHLIKKPHTDGVLFRFGRENIDHVPTNPEGAAPQLHVIAGVLHLRKPLQDRPLIHDGGLFQMQDHRVIGGRVTQTIDSRDRTDNDGIRALKQRLGGRQPHLFNVFVYRRILLDEGVRGRHIGLGLVVVVVGNEILDRVVRKEVPHFRIKLGGKGLVGGQHQGGALDTGDHVGDGEGLAGSRHPKQCLEGKPRLETLDQGLDRPRLVTGRRVDTGDLKLFGNALWLHRLSVYYERGSMS